MRLGRRLVSTRRFPMSRQANSIDQEQKETKDPAVTPGFGLPNARWLLASSLAFRIGPGIRTMPGPFFSVSDWLAGHRLSNAVSVELRLQCALCIRVAPRKSTWSRRCKTRFRCMPPKVRLATVSGTWMIRSGCHPERSNELHPLLGRPIP